MRGGGGWLQQIEHAATSNVLLQAPPSGAPRHLPRSYSLAGRIRSLTLITSESWMPAFAGMTKFWGLRLRRGWSSLDAKAPSVLRTAPPTSWWSAMYNLAQNLRRSPSAQLAGGGARRAEGESA